MKKFVVIDGMAIIYRGYYALPPLTTRQGELVNAVFGFTTILLNMLEKVNPDYLAVAFDLKGPTFRHESYEDYKGTRAETPDDLIAQIPRIRDIVQAFQIPMLEREGFEADDLIATLAERLRDEAEIELLIVTGDMDLTQLITDRVKLLAPLTGFNDVKTYDIAAVHEKYGLRPDQMVDYKALVGDTSDNIPGVPGIGPKTASSLLQQYETLDGVYAHVDTLSEGVRSKLIAGKASAERSKALVTLVRDVPLTLDIEDCHAHQVDARRIHLLFEALEFKRLIAKFQALQDRWAEREQPALF